jgi:hypothetical protein
VLDNVTDAEFGIVVEAELVLPIAPRDPDVDEVRILRAQDRLTGDEGQTDRFAVELGILKPFPEAIGGNAEFRTDLSRQHVRAGKIGFVLSKSTLPYGSPPPTSFAG